MAFDLQAGFDLGSTMNVFKAIYFEIWTVVDILKTKFIYFDFTFPNLISGDQDALDELDYSMCLEIGTDVVVNRFQWVPKINMAHCYI